jgi:hypothetical protein
MGNTRTGLSIIASINIESPRQKTDNNPPGCFGFVKWPARGKLGIPNHSVLVDKFAKANPYFVAINNTRSQICHHPSFPSSPLTAAMKYHSNHREIPPSFLSTNTTILSRLYTDDHSDLSRSTSWHTSEFFTTSGITYAPYIEHSKKGRRRRTRRHDIFTRSRYLYPSNNRSRSARERTYASLRRHSCWPLCPLFIRPCLQCSLAHQEAERKREKEQWEITKQLNRVLGFLVAAIIMTELITDLLGNRALLAEDRERREREVRERIELPSESSSSSSSSDSDSD